MPDLATLDHQRFAALDERAFTLHAPDGRILTIELSAIAPWGAASARRRQPFSLEFLAPQGCGLPQAIYRLSHPALGELEIFLVPLGPCAAGERYEAVFS